MRISVIKSSQSAPALGCPCLSLGASGTPLCAVRAKSGVSGRSSDDVDVSPYGFQSRSAEFVGPRTTKQPLALWRDAARPAANGAHHHEGRREKQDKRRGTPFLGLAVFVQNKQGLSLSL